MQGIPPTDQPAPWKPVSDGECPQGEPKLGDPSLDSNTGNLGKDPKMSKELFAGAIQSLQVQLQD